jgi:electron transport complex protein RnfG
MGLFVLEQKETPGLGANITNKPWRKQFSGKPAKPLVAVKTGAQAPGEIDAITGATISSKSVTRILNSALSDLKNKLQ